MYVCWSVFTTGALLLAQNVLKEEGVCMCKHGMAKWLRRWHHNLDVLGSILVCSILGKSYFL